MNTTTQAAPERAELIERPAHAVAQPAITGHDDVLMQAMARGFTPDQISQMMDLRDRQHRHVAETEFRKDFAGFRGENIIVPKSKSVDRGRAGSFIQAEYHIAANLLSPALSRHGFGFRHDQKFGSRKWAGDDGIERDVPWVYVTCFLEHRSGHVERLELEGPPGELSANTPVQNMQATASYLKRQSLLAITGTATGGEDDENNLHPKRERQAATGGSEQDLSEWQDVALEGMAKLRAFYEKTRPSDEWWSANSRALRVAATAADKRMADAQGVTS